MTRTGTSKEVGPGHALNRFRKARAYHETARLACEHIDRLGDSDPIASNVALAAIAYADAITATYSGLVNQKDHATAAKLLRNSLGKSLPDSQLRLFVKLVGAKDEVQYGARPGRSDAAAGLIKNLDEFARWTRTVLAARSVSPDE
jgi:hypothetical protein